MFFEGSTGGIPDTSHPVGMPSVSGMPAEQNILFHGNG
jgi:hypothetical protein